MKTKLTISIIMLSAISMIACNKVLETDITPIYPVSNVHFSASIDTRALLEPNATDTAFTPQWENETDVIGVEYLNDNLDEGLVAGTWNSSNVCFDSTLPEYTGEWVYDAFYPYVEENGKSIPFGPARTQYGNSYNSSYDVMIADRETVANAPQGKTDLGENVEFQMNRKTAIVYFHITSNVDEIVDYAVLTINGENKFIACDNIEVSLSDHAITVPAGASKSNSITTTFDPDTAPSMKNVMVWFNIVPTEYDSLKFELYSTNHYYTISKSSNGTFAEGMLYTIKKTATSFETFATLPFSISGEGGSIAYSSIMGLSASNLGTDYAEANSPYLTKLDNTGDYVQVRFNKPATSVSFAVKKIGGKANSTIYVQGSSNGTDFEDIESAQITGAQNAIVSHTTTSQINPNYRYIRLLFNKGNNVGLGPWSVSNKVIEFLTLSKSSETVDAAATSTTFDIESNTDWSISVDGEGTSVSTTEGNGNANITVEFPANAVNEEVTAAVVTVTAGEIKRTFTVKQKANTSAIEPKTIAEFISLADTEKNYRLVGVATNISGKNFTLTDNSGSIYVYGLTTTPTFVDGDIVTLYGKYKKYNEKDEVVGGIYESHITTPKLSVSTNTINVQATDTSATFTVSTSGDISWYVTHDGEIINDITTGDAVDGKTTVTLSFDANDGDARSETITVSSDTDNVYKVPQQITFTQEKAGGKKYTVLFGQSYNSNEINSYSNSWYVKVDNKQFLDLNNWNNNNNKWDYVKTGSKNNAVTGTMTTHAAIADAISKVTITIDAITSNSITSLTLYVSSKSSFPDNNTTSYSISKSTGSQSITIPSPTKNCYYKLEAVCQKASSNGTLTISKFVFE